MVAGRGLRAEGPLRGARRGRARHRHAAARDAAPRLGARAPGLRRGGRRGGGPPLAPHGRRARRRGRGAADEAAGLRAQDAAQRRGDRRLRRGVGRRRIPKALDARASSSASASSSGARSSAGRPSCACRRTARGAPRRRAPCSRRRARAARPRATRRSTRSCAAICARSGRRAPTTSRAGSAGARRRCARRFERLGDELARFEDENGRALYDLPDAPRPDAETPGPAAPARRLRQRPARLRGQAPRRILPDGHRDAVYERRNLQIRPSYLVDGLVAGTWSIEVKRAQATLTLRPLERLARATRRSWSARPSASCAHCGPTRRATRSRSSVRAPETPPGKRCRKRRWRPSNPSSIWPTRSPPWNGPSSASGCSSSSTRTRRRSPIA